ncbi:MAG TPA: hypothetical protein VK470_18005, partial [Bacteroidota bacterium]|nr:hypothetical protein [Bacteroidota bacterium]
MTTFPSYIQLLGRPDSYAAKWLLLLVSGFCMALMFPSSISVENEYATGTVWTDSDLYAPFSFPLYKDEQQYAREQASAAAHVYRVFEVETDVARSSTDSLVRFFEALRVIIDKRTADSAVINRYVRSLPVSFTESEWKTLWHLRAGDKRGSRLSLTALERDVTEVMDRLYAQGIIETRSSSFAQLPGDTAVAVRRKTIERIMPLSSFIDQTSLGRLAEETFGMLYKADSDTVSVAAKILLSFVVPNIRFQQEQTEQEVRFAVESVPRTYGAVKEGDRIIRKNERITEDVKRKLDSLRKSKIERGADTNRAATF